MNGAAKPLEGFLSKRDLVKRISRAVILTHDRSAVGRVERQTVDYIGTLAEVTVDRVFSRHAPRLDRASTVNVVRRIQGDHEFHRKRSSRSKRFGRRRR